jgi:HEAT repeat protein
MKINQEKATVSAEKMLTDDESWLVRFKAVEILAKVRFQGYKDMLRKHLSSETNKYVREKIQNILEVL